MFNIEIISVNIDKDDIFIQFKNDRCRLDEFEKMTVMTQELFDRVKTLAESNLQQSLSHFLCGENI